MLAGLFNSEAISGARFSAQVHSLMIENLSADAASRRWPGFRVPDEFDFVFELEAGFLKVEECVQSYLDCAVAHGARLHLNDPVVSWPAADRQVQVRTMNGEFVARSLVITAGAWSAGLMSDLNLPLQVLRKPIFWHKTTSEVVPGVVEKLAAAPAGLTSPVESYPQTGGCRHEFKVSVIEEESQVSSQTRSGASQPSARRFTGRAFVVAW